MRRAGGWIAGALSVLLLFEAGLWVAGPWLPMALRNLFLSGYSDSSAGIYFREPRTGVVFMKPHFRRPMFYNGYTWEHATNAWGLRDGELDRADVVLLGDSRVYGHGVETGETMDAQLERLTGLTVANAGHQGDYPPLELYRLKTLGLFFRPRVVFFFLNGNQDVTDFASYDEARQRRLMQSRTAAYSRGPAAAAPVRAYPTEARGRDGVWEHCRTLKLLRLAAATRLPRAQAWKTWGSEEALAPVLEPILRETDRLCRCWSL
jgi:hypothetical protein